MASNINTVYFQYWKDFSLLGKSMNKYAIASWISLAASFLGNFIIQAIFMGPMMVSMESQTFDDPYALLIGMGGILLFFALITLAISIYKFVTFIQYLMQLKKIGEYTNDIDLQKAYKMELWALILSFFIWFILILGLIIIYIVISSMDNFMPETFISIYLLAVLGFIFAIFIVVTLTIIFQILSAVAFDKWGHKIKMANFQNRKAVNIADGTSFMKFGRFITISAAPMAIIFTMLGIIADMVGMVLFLIGLMKTGNNITKFFDEYGNNQSSQSSAFPQSSRVSTFQQPVASTSNSNPNPNSISMGNDLYGNTTLKPQGDEFCIFCSSKLQEKNSKFCPNCGRKLL